MRFEFDADKSAGNKDKHGINFVEAQALWDDWDLLEIPAKTVALLLARLAQHTGRRSSPIVMM